MGKRAFERVVVIIFENEFRGSVMQNSYMRSLAAKGIELANYFGVMHPSNTNYVASVAGEICNISSDPLYYTFLPEPQGAPAPAPGPEPMPQKTIADVIVENGLEWRAYMAGYSPVAFPPSLAPILDPSSGQIDVAATVSQTILDYPPYLNMHNPFVRFSSIVNDENQWKRIGTSHDFLRDALDGTLPQYSWFTPNMWDCGHWLYGTYNEPAQRAPFLVDQLAKWLESFFGVLAFPGPGSRMPKGTLVVVTFDEADMNKSYEEIRNWDSTYDGPNQIYTVLLGDTITPQRIEQEGYNHYSLLRTVEKNFDLPALGTNDTDANWFQFLWGKTYAWGAPEPTPIENATTVAAASLGDTLYAVYGSGGALSCRTRTNGTWSPAQDVAGPQNVTTVAMASANGNLTLICQSGGALSALSLSNGAWSAPQQVATGVQAFSLVSYLDYGDQTEKLMLAWSSDSGLQSQIFANGQWTTPVAVGQQGGGAVVLATLGASVFLIHQAGGTSLMNVASYNTAPFNVVTSAGDSNTTQYAWSPSVYPVQHFAAGPTRAPGGDDSLAPYQGAAPFAAASLDGVIHFIHRAAKDSILCSTTFSISGVLTPQNPVSYKQSGTGLSNGYGTLAEAGWSRRAQVSGLPVEGSSAMALARAGRDLVLLWQERSGSPLHLTSGRYR
ncbi:MAG TPA: alkaline phosphatase family protein [Thermoanaerobaculia bacterium]|nr:alkaline phosphatase family protein [Thermoanaerobaculia bacterium]